MAWSGAAKKELPPQAAVDDKPGYVTAVNVQGLTLSGYDHYAVEDLPSGGVRISAWNDDPDDYPESEWFAESWTCEPLCSDSSLGGAINTRQKREVFCGPAGSPGAAHRAHYDTTPRQGTTVRDWADWVEPAAELVKHGVWLSAEDHEAHVAARSAKGWRDAEWTDHLDPSECDETGRLKGQACQGRMAPSNGTRYFQLSSLEFGNTTDPHSVNTAHGCVYQLTDNASNIPTGTTTSQSYSASEEHLEWKFYGATLCQHDWPLVSDYACQLDVTSAGSGLSYGFLTLGAIAGHFCCVDRSDTSESDGKAQNESAFTGTGLKLATSNGNDFSGPNHVTGDPHRGYEFMAFMACQRDGVGHGNQSVTIEKGNGDADAFLRMPGWAYNSQMNTQRHNGGISKGVFSGMVV